MMMRFRAELGACDLMVAASGNGRGRIMVDATPETMLLSQIGSDRRADPSDTLPQEVALLPAQSGGAFGRRGWPGDTLLPLATRQGSRLWLLSRGKADEDDRVAAIGYAAEAVGPVADYTGVDAQVTAGWLRAGVLQISVTVASTTVRARAGRA
ncbi:phage GP46 family protein [Acetobacter fallax]|nr:phage GP46 family protein [Acetobacter fallax]